MRRLPTSSVALPSTKHRALADEDGVHRVVVAVDHAGQTAVLIDTILGVGGEPFGIDDDAVGPVAGAQMTRVDEVVWRDRYDGAITDADNAHRRGGGGAVEPAAVADDRVVGHQAIEQRVLAGVNDIREQI